MRCKPKLSHRREPSKVGHTQNKSKYYY